jgi:hypothetical protein
MIGCQPISGMRKKEASKGKRAKIDMAINKVFRISSRTVSRLFTEGSSASSVCLVIIGETSKNEHHLN